MKIKHRVVISDVANNDRHYAKIGAVFQCPCALGIKIGKLVSETFTFKNLMDEKNDENYWSFK